MNDHAIVVTVIFFGNAITAGEAASGVFVTFGVFVVPIVDVLRQMTHTNSEHLRLGVADGTLLFDVRQAFFSIRGTAGPMWIRGRAFDEGGDQLRGRQTFSVQGRTTHTFYLRSKRLLIDSRTWLMDAASSWCRSIQVSALAM